MAQNTVHVSDASGTNNSSCGSAGSPCATIQYAIDNIAVDGDSVRIDTGEYSLASSTSSYTPVVQLPEGKSLHFVGSTDGQGTRINGGQTRRGFLYYYIGTGCNTGSTSDGISDTLVFTFRHLIIEDCKITETCGTTSYAYGGGMRLDCDSASEMHVWIDDCIFRNNQAFDSPGTFAGGRSASGGAIFILGRRADYAGSSNYAQAHINNCDFQGNYANQNWNGGHGGAILLRDLDTASVTNSSFCDNYCYSQNADNGDLQHDRNAGGAICVYDLWNSTPAHGYHISNCTFINNSATTNGGATYTFQSEGGAVFLTKGDVLSGQTTATLHIDNSSFYGNFIETGIEHIDANGGTLDTSSIGFNAYYGQFGVGLGPDTQMCPGDSIVLDAQLPGGVYMWSDGSTGPTLTVLDSGTFSVTVTVGQCELSDTIHIAIQPFPTPDLGADSSLCPNDSVEYDVTLAGASYLWSTGSTASSQYVYGNDSVWVEVTLNGCAGSDTLVTDTIEIYKHYFPEDTLMCPFEILVLDASTPGASYIWTDNSSGATLTVDQPGEYRVTVTKQGCTSSDTIVVDYVDNVTDIIGNDSSTCEGDTIVLEVLQNPLDGILWENGSNTNIRFIQSSGTYWVEINDRGCFFSDTVSLIFNTTPIADLGNDTSACEGDTIILDASCSSCTYQWGDGAPYATRFVTASGLYKVTVDYFGCTAVDEIYVELFRIPRVKLPENTSICEGQQLQLKPSMDVGNFYWQDGSTDRTYNASEAGIYAVTVSNNGCAASDSMVLGIDSMPVFDLGANDTVCAPEVRILETGLEEVVHVWQDSSMSPTYLVDATGKHWVTVIDGACTTSDTIYLKVIPLPEVSLGPDTSICFGDTFSYRMPKDSLTYLWSDGKHDRTYLVEGEDALWLQASNVCGSTRDSVIVSTIECDCPFYLPNAFTPDRNQLNPTYGIFHACDFERFEFWIFDRWGNQIFHTTDPAFQWDGTGEGKNIPMGVYAYHYRYTALVNADRDRIKKEGFGQITLLR